MSLFEILIFINVKVLIMQFYKFYDVKDLFSFKYKNSLKGKNMLTIGRSCNKSYKLSTPMKNHSTMLPAYNIKFEGALKHNNSAFSQISQGLRHIGQNIKSIINSKINLYTSQVKLQDIDNVQGYLKLNEGEKRKFRRLFQKEIIGKSIAHFNPEYKHPFQSEAELKELFRFSRIIAHSFKDSKVVAVGRSPLWFLETLKMMKGSKVNLDNYSELAVTGLTSVNNFTKTEIKEFAGYLKNANLSPETMIEHSKKTGQKTVLFDFLHTGKGMIQTINLMDEVLKHNYKNNIAPLKSEFKSSDEAIKAFHDSIKVVGMFWKDHKPASLPANVDKKLYQVDYDLSVNFFDHIFRDDLGTEFLRIDWEDVNPLDVKPTDRARLSRFMLIDKLFQKGLLKEGQRA